MGTVYRSGLLVGLLLITLFAGCVEKVEDGIENAGEAVTPGKEGPADSARGEGPGSEPDPDSSDPDAPGVPDVPNRTISWADPDDATIRPGVVMESDGGQCTSNFVFTDRALTKVYLGFAAHCVADGAATDTNACEDGVTPFDLGAQVDVEGASRPASLAYTSWGAMLDANETGDGVCANNDFAVVELDPDDWGAVNPAMLQFGGPSALATSSDARPRAKLLSYGHSGLRMGTETLNPREGYVLESFDGGWGHAAVFVTSGVPGDSGSGVLTGDGRALGILVTLGAGTNGIANLDKALEYARSHGGPDLVLATWDPMDDGVLPPL